MCHVPNCRIYLYLHTFLSPSSLEGGQQESQVVVDETLRSNMNNVFIAIGQSAPSISLFIYLIVCLVFDIETLDFRKCVSK